MPRLRPILLLLLLALVAGCIRQHPLASPPVLRVWLTDIEIIGVGLPEQHYRVSLRIQNPNSYPLSAIGISLHLHLNEGHLSHGVSNQPFGLAALGETRIQMDVTSLDPAMAELVRWASPPNYGSLPYQLEGSLTLANEIPPIPFKANGFLGQPPAPKD